MKNKILYISRAAMIAALYVVLTELSNLFGLASGVIQFRLSEALCVLPVFSSAAIPGLTVGCIIANLLTGAPIWDVIFGPLATLIGAVGAYLLRRYIWLSPLPTIASNALIIPLVLRYAYSVNDAFIFLVATVGLGEIVCCGVLGTVLLIALKPVSRRLFG